MRVVINQPNYMPWRGYFDLIEDADVFLLHDDVQYTKQDWRNRNRIKTARGLVWLTVPVQKVTTATLIKDVRIDYREAWPALHRRVLQDAYGAAPYFAAYSEAFGALLEQRYATLLELDVATIGFVMQALGITTPVKTVSALGCSGVKTEKLLNILQSVGGDIYLSGPAAKAYIDSASFAAAGIGLEWKAYDYAPYPQLHGAFAPQVSVLDLLFNCGPEARRYLKSR